jgi:hypothetical protein
MSRLELKVWPVDIAGSGIAGIGGAILVLIIVLLWLTMAAPSFVY